IMLKKATYCRHGRANVRWTGARDAEALRYRRGLTAALQLCLDFRARIADLLDGVLDRLLRYAALLGEVFNSQSSIADRRERSCALRCFLSSAMALNLALVSVVGGLLHIARAFLQLALDLL